MRSPYLSQIVQISFAFAVILCSAVFADTITWIGTTSSDWNTTSNWSTGAVPTATDDVIIIKGTANLPTIDADYSVKTLTLKTDADTPFKSMAAGYYAAKDFKAYTCLVGSTTTTYADFTGYLNAGSTKGISTTTDATGTRYYNNPSGSGDNRWFYYIGNKLKDNNGVVYNATARELLSNEPTMGDVIVNKDALLRPGDYAKFSDNTKYHMYEARIELKNYRFLVSSGSTLPLDQQMTYAYRDLVLNGGYISNGNYPCIVSGNITLQSNSLIHMADGYRKRTITLDNVVMKSNNSAAILTIKDNTTYLGTLPIQNSDFSGFNGSTIQLGDVPASAGAVVLGSGVTGTDQVNWKFVATTADKCYIENSVAGTFQLGAIESAISNADIRAGVEGATTYEIGGLNKDSSYAGKITNGSGTVSINKTGTGTLTLSSANTYTGGTTVSAGTLALTGTTNLNNSTSITNNAAITAESAQTLNNLSGTVNTASISIGANALTLNNTADSSYAGTITGMDTSVTKTGDGKLTLSGENTYNGGTTITGGRIIATNASALGTNNVTNNSQLEFNLGTDETYGKIISGTGAVIKTGSGTLAFTKNNTFTGGMTISEGKVSVLTIYTGLGDGALTLETGATLMIFGGALKEMLTISGAATLNGTLDLSEYLTTWDTSKEYTLMTTGSIVNTTGLTLSGVGTGWGWEQSENNILLKYTAGTLGWNWTGATGSFMTAANWENTKVPEATSDVTITKADGKAQIDADTVVNSVTLGTASNLQFTAGKTLTAQTMTMGGTDALNLTGGNLTLTNAPAFDITNGDTTNKSTLTLSTGAYANVLSGNTNLTKTGTGTLTLSGVNTYTGATTVSGGTLALTVDNAIASSASVENNAAISFGNTAQTFKALTGSGTITGSGALTLLNDTNTSYSGTITGDASVTKNDAGTLTLSGANTYTGTTTVNAGKLVLTGNANLESSEGVIIAAGAEMDLSGMAGTQQYNVISSAGTIKGNSSTVLDIDVAASQVRTLTGSLSGIASINKTGNGTLKMNLGQETAPLTVGEIASTAGRLNMQGYYFANISIQGGTFSPGMDLVGKINQLGTFVLSDNALLDLNLVGKNGSNFTFDQLEVVGDVDFSTDSEITFTWNNILPNANGTFNLITATNGEITYPDDFDGDAILASAGMDINFWSVEGSPHALALIYSGGGGGGGGGDQSVPEPSTWALLILGALGLWGLRRRK